VDGEERTKRERRETTFGRFVGLCVCSSTQAAKGDTDVTLFTVFHSHGHAVHKLSRKKKKKEKSGRKLTVKNHDGPS
jgi:Zn-dependent oligopeptidase